MPRALDVHDANDAAVPLRQLEGLVGRALTRTLTLTLTLTCALAGAAMLGAAVLRGSAPVRTHEPG